MTRNELESRGRFLHIPGAMLGVGDGQVFMSSKGFFLYQVQRDLFFLKFKGNYQHQLENEGVGRQLCSQ